MLNKKNIVRSGIVFYSFVAVFSFIAAIERYIYSYHAAPTYEYWITGFIMTTIFVIMHFMSVLIVINLVTKFNLSKN